MKLKNEFIKLNSPQRLYQIPIPIIALTGGIATGKSSVSKLLRVNGLAVICADQLVKEIYRLPETINYIKENFPKAIEDEKINFPCLRETVFSHPQLKNQIEHFIYQRLPMVFAKNYEQLAPNDLLVYDIPLLYEKKMQNLFDLSVLVYAPRSIQIERLIQRDNIDIEMAKNILNHQMDIEEKKLKADFIVDNSGTLQDLPKEVDRLLRQILE